MTFTVTFCNKRQNTKNAGTSPAAKSLKRRPDLNAITQYRSVDTGKELARLQWLDAMAREQAPQHSAAFQTRALKCAVAESAIYHHTNQSATLGKMLQGTNPALATDPKASRQRSHGIMKVYFDTIIEDIDGIVTSYGCAQAQKSVRVLPLWKLAGAPAQKLSC